MSTKRQFILIAVCILLFPIVLMVLLLAGTGVLGAACLLLSWLLLIALLLFIVLRKELRLLRPYNQAPLDIRTFDGLDAPYHPSVRYFPEAWNGYQFWMAETPFSPECRPYRDANEIPSIHVSHDGVHWKEPSGLANPIIRMSAGSLAELDYYSDPHIVMKDDVMEVWYRKTERHGEVHNHQDVTLRKVVSTDGIHWSDEIVVAAIQQENCQMHKGLFVSPALLWLENEYVMYAVRYDFSGTTGAAKLVRTCSPDGFTWSAEELCRLDGRDVCPWHIDVQYVGDMFYLVVYDMTTNVLTLWRSADGRCFSYVRDLLKPSHVRGSFYSRGLYRSCLVQTDNKCYLYFTASTGWDAYIGLMAGDSPENLSIVSVDGKDRGLMAYCKQLCRNAFLTAKHIRKH